MDVITNLIGAALSSTGSSVTCRICRKGIATRDDFGRSERVCRACRGR